MCIVKFKYLAHVTCIVNKKGILKMSNYVSVCLPRKLTNIVDEKVEKLGYTSRADFIKQAIRNELTKLRNKEVQHGT
jgi:metal-responsive CopG/Arc/MetJ family transcriptional regulator